MAASLGALARDVVVSAALAIATAAANSYGAVEGMNYYYMT